MNFERQVGVWFAAAVLVAALLWLLSDILLPFVAGMALAFFLNPLTNWLERWGVRRSLAAMVIVGLVVLAFVFLALLVVPVLARHRTDATRHARALVAAGTLGQWMIEWSPRLACTSKKPAVMEAIGELPDLAILPEMHAVLSASPLQAARTIAGGLSSGAFGISHRAVLVNVVARVQPASLPALAEAIGHIDPSQPSIGLAFALADLARLRHQMLTELEPS
jgi:hypothetical protein